MFDFCKSRAGRAAQRNFFNFVVQRRCTTGKCSDPHEGGVEKHRVEKHRVCRHIIGWRRRYPQWLVYTFITHSNLSSHSDSSVTIQYLEERPRRLCTVKPRCDVIVLVMVTPPTRTTQSNCLRPCNHDSVQQLHMVVLHTDSTHDCVHHNNARMDWLLFIYTQSNWYVSQ